MLQRTKVITRYNINIYDLAIQFRMIIEGHMA